MYVDMYVDHAPVGITRGASSSKSAKRAKGGGAAALECFLSSATLLEQNASALPDSFPPYMVAFPAVVASSPPPPPPVGSDTGEDCVGAGWGAFVAVGVVGWGGVGAGSSPPPSPPGKHAM